MRIQDFLVRLIDLTKRTDYGYWCSFRDSNPDTLHAFRFDDGADGGEHLEVTVIITPDYVRIGKYPGDFQAATYEREKSWDALSYIDRLLKERP
jgi:hypothetical protein